MLLLVLSKIVILLYYRLVVVVVTRHGGVATFAEAAFKLQPQDTETQGTFQVEKEWYQSGKVAEAMEGRIV